MLLAKVLTQKMAGQMGYWHEPKFLPGSVFRNGTIKDGLSETWVLSYGFWHYSILLQPYRLGRRGKFNASLY
jgi:hypothetical protein